MFVSARRIFRHDQSAWSDYIAWIQLSGLQQIRSVDRRINNILPNSPTCDCIMSDHIAALRQLPAVVPDIEYYQLAINLSYEKAPTWIDSARFLGCDLADDTWRSSLFNYGPWTGELKKYASHLNEYGLLRVADAHAVKELMHTQWERAFAYVDMNIWALYELPLEMAGAAAAQITSSEREIHVD